MEQKSPCHSRPLLSLCVSLVFPGLSLSLSLSGPTWFPAVVSPLWSPSPSLPPRKLRKGSGPTHLLKCKSPVPLPLLSRQEFQPELFGKVSMPFSPSFVFMCFSCLPRSLSLSCICKGKGKGKRQMQRRMHRILRLLATCKARVNLEVVTGTRHSSVGTVHMSSVGVHQRAWKRVRSRV